MAVIIQCPNPNCGKAYQVNEGYLGKATRCTQCGQHFTPTARSGGPATAINTLPPDARATVGPPPAPRAEMTPPSPLHPTAGQPQQIGRFLIHERVGAGGFAIVYRAYDPRLDREIALKVPLPGTLDGARAIQRFLQEAKAAAQLHHPHIVPIFETGGDGEHHYIAAAFIKGQTLARAIDEGRLTLRQKVQIVRDLADALAYAHGKGIIHRDVKPANIMLDGKGDAYLTDFGLAYRVDASYRLTQDGALLGTPDYMAPEQAGGQTCDPESACDQYSLGVVLYELLCGQKPFGGPWQVVLYNTLHTLPRPPRSLNADVPLDLETICLKAMAKRPKERYPTCLELADDLRRWLEGQKDRHGLPEVVNQPRVPIGAGPARTKSNSIRPASPPRAPTLGVREIEKAPQHAGQTRNVRAADREIVPVAGPFFGFTAALGRTMKWFGQVPFWVWIAGGGAAVVLVLLALTLARIKLGTGVPQLNDPGVDLATNHENGAVAQTTEEYERLDKVPRVVTEAKPSNGEASNSAPSAPRFPKPSTDRTPIGKHALALPSPNVLLQRQRGEQGWRLLRPDLDNVHTDDLLLTLPGFRGEIRLDSKVNLLLWGTPPEKLKVPLLESAITLHAVSHGQRGSPDVDFTLERGRVIISSQKAEPVRVRVRFHEEVWDLTLQVQGTEIGIELLGREGGFETGEGPLAFLKLGVLKRRAWIQIGNQGYALQAPPGPAQFVWRNRGPGAQGPIRQEEEDHYLIQNLLEQSKSMDNSLKELSSRLTAGKAINVVLAEDVDSSHATARTLAVLSLGAVDDLPALLDALSDGSYFDVREAAVTALRHWLGRRDGQNNLVRQALLDKRYTTTQTDILMQLLHSFPPEDQRKLETYEVLIEYLNHDKPAVRQLAHWHLVRLSPEGRKIPYSPVAGLQERKDCYYHWKQLLADGKLVPKVPARPRDRP